MRVHARQLEYRVALEHGGLLAGIYMIVACASPMLSSHGRISPFGVANPLAAAP